MRKNKTMTKKLAQKIQSLEEIIKDLDQLESNDSAETVSQLLKIMTNLFEEVEQRLTELEKKKANDKKKKTPSTNRNH